MREGRLGGDWMARWATAAVMVEVAMAEEVMGVVKAAAKGEVLAVVLAVVRACSTLPWRHR